jgi:hypothetical protein
LEVKDYLPGNRSGQADLASVIKPQSCIKKIAKRLKTVVTIELTT